MAKTIWEDKAKNEFLTYVENAALEFGASTAKRWQKERLEIEWRLEQYPTSYSPEKLLQGMEELYRYCHIMSRRFKIVYYFDEVENVVHIIDIWDTRMSPKALIRRI